jgi:hypothetical protein
MRGDSIAVTVPHDLLIEHQGNHGHIMWLISVVVDRNTAAGDNGGARNVGISCECEAPCSHQVRLRNPRGHCIRV